MALPTPDGVVALDLDLSTLPDEAGIYWLQRETGALPDNHLLVQLMRSAMLGSIGRSPTSDELPTLLAWQRQLMMRGGRAINHLLIGPGMHGQGSDWSSCYVNPASFHEVTNLAGFSYDTVKQSMERVDYGTSLPDVLRAQLALDATGDLCIETDVSKVFLVTASSDAGACAPNLEVDTARLQLVGSALGPITYEELEAKISDGSAPEIASKLNTSVLAVIVQSLASKSGGAFHQCVATMGSTAGGGATTVGARYNQILPSVEACSMCLKEAIEAGGLPECKRGCPWNACNEPLSPGDAGAVCERCRSCGVKSAHPMVRARIDSKSTSFARTSTSSRICRPCSAEGTRGAHDTSGSRRYSASARGVVTFVSSSASGSTHLRTAFPKWHWRAWRSLRRSMSPGARKESAVISCPRSYNVKVGAVTRGGERRRDGEGRKGRALFRRTVNKCG